MFNQADIYTSSGSAKLYNSWTPSVAKFDTSSFYNWEQDNLPIYDLDERTYELWEYNGFPTSSVPGLALTVSANTPAATLATNRNIYTTVSAAIASLPRVVRFPILIEVCNFGDLGKIELNDFQIVENGSIEIINRNYGTIYGTNVANGQRSVFRAPNTGNPVGHTYSSGFSSIDLSATISTGASATSAVNLGITVFSGINDVRLSSTNSVTYPLVSYVRGPLSVAINTATTYSNLANSFLTRYYEFTGTGGFTAIDIMNSLDHSSVNQFSQTLLTRPPHVINDECLGALYGNNASQISVKNCSGKIFIRNFFVNGGNRTVSYGGNDNAIEVTNSEVVLENCVGAAAKKNGFLFNNSKVILSRMAYAYRNYEQLTQTTRSSEQSCGFRAVNSEITLSSLVGGGAAISGKDYQTSGANTIFIASRNKIGFLLENSILNGGVQRLSSSLQNEKSALISELNNEAGIKAINSQIKLKGLIDVYENYDGIVLENSKLSTEELCCDAHTEVGLKAKNSTIIFNETLLNLSAQMGDVRQSVQFSANGQHMNLDNSHFSFARTTSMPFVYGGLDFLENHGVERYLTYINNTPSIKLLNNSKLELINSQHISTSAGVESNSVCYGKLISAENNSTVSLYGTGNRCTTVFGPTVFDKQRYLAAIHAKNGSTINLYGPTVIGHAGIDVLVENNSTLNIEPPLDPNTNQLDISGMYLTSGSNHTSVDLHATRACLVADNNSTINMQNLGYFGNLWTGTNGAAVLAKGSDFDTIGANIEDYISSGSIRFYPNPYNEAVVTASGTDVTNYTVIQDQPVFAVEPNSKRYEFITNTPSIGGVCVRALNSSIVNAHNVHFGEGSNDGPLDGLYYNAESNSCHHLHIWNLADDSKLRASLLSLSGSYGADTVYHGPPSFYTSSTTKGVAAGAAVPAFFAPSATPDTGTLSVLDAFGAGGSSVSAAWKTIPGVGVNDPFDRFFATSGSYNNVLASAVANAAGLTVSGLTSSGLQYGTSAAAGTTYNNCGLFRLYFSVDPAARYLQHNASGYGWGEVAWNTTGSIFSGASGVAYQVFAQGYNMSASLSSIDPLFVSAVHPKLMKLSSDTNGDGVPNTLYPSGFYYCVEFVPNDPTQVIIDESAANVFANSKNASLGSSGRPKKVTIYKSGTQTAGESNTGSTGTTNTSISTNIFDLKRDN